MAIAAGTDTDLQELARRHLWMHFARHGAYAAGARVPVIVRGEGCHVWDDEGRRYIDGLSALFCVNIGHGRADVAQAGADQARELGFFTNWSFAHPRA
ncbi:MAG TPA: aminotransferase class III-fold pyridoxal phosphate-dependent enzyme, partial [Baekduia sp.]|nr:aminotransferase class III-fold pyridoxal phosphate-dependent enzyme [Baekduia sp.]